MLSREGKQTDRGAVGAEFIGYNRRRREALLLQEFPHQPNCRPSVPAGLNQEIQDFALTVHGTPEIELPPSNYDDHLVQVPAFGRSWPPTLNPPRIGPTEFQDPSSNCLIRDVETTLGKQVLNVPIAQRETAIEPDGMLDDDRWKAVATVGYLAHPEMLKHRPCRSHAVNVTMPREAVGVDTNQRLAGVLSGLSKQAATFNLPARAVFTIENESKSGETKKTYVVSNHFLETATENNWPLDETGNPEQGNRRMPDSQITCHPIASLAPWARNARTHSKKQIRQIADSIVQFGFTNPVLIDEAGTILAGHGRVTAAASTGVESGRHHDSDHWRSV